MNQRIILATFWVNPRNLVTDTGVAAVLAVNVTVFPGVAVDCKRVFCDPLKAIRL